MCGISGIFRQNGLREPDSRAIDRSLERLNARGPDSKGVFRNGQVILGHRRLAILDPQMGAQPWEDPESGVVLTYNGELFNYRELRGTLEACGHVFQTNCDTEVLMHAYLEWGLDALGHLNGMFAFAILDQKANRLWLVRDRLGVKPLFLFQGKGFLAFASSVAGLLVHPEIDSVWDPVALGHYFLTIRTSLGSRTMIQGVESLMPGEFFSLDLKSGKSTRKTYWRLPVVAPSDKPTRDLNPMLCEELGSLFDQAVQGQLISDVPLGGFLSGGLDSSVLVGSILSGKAAPFHAYNIGYKRTGYNEWNYVREAAEFHGIDCRMIELEEEGYLDDWRSLIAFKGLPLSTPNEVPILRLAKAFRGEFTVAMTGEGADEIFGGYTLPTFCAFDYDRSHGSHGGISPEALQRGYGRTNLGTRREHFLMVNSWLSESVQKSLLPGLFRGKDSPLEKVSAWYDTLFDSLNDCSTFDAYLHVHARVNLEGLLNRLDNSTMAASVEGRVPYTDHRIAEWAFALPDHLKMNLRSGFNADDVSHLNIFDLQQNNCIESKRMLRATFQDRVPVPVLKREKVSFPVPFQEWFNSWLREPYQQVLRHSNLASSILDPHFRLQEMGAKSNINGMLAWPLMNLAIMEELWDVRL